MDLNYLSQILFGIDPIMALGLSTVVVGAGGWLAGPVMGSAVFRAMHRKEKAEIARVS